MNENFEIEKSSLNNIEQMADIWGNPVVKVLYSTLKIIPPVGELIDTTVNKALYEFQKKKQEVLCEIIFSDNTITMEDARDITFIMEFARTLNVVNKLVSNEKVKYIANLFKKTFSKMSYHDNISEYEEYLQRLDYISVREIDMVHLLYQAESSLNPERLKDATSIFAAWDAFKINATKKFDLKEDIIIAIMSGISMSGFCREAIYMYPADDIVEIPFFTTEYFARFLDLIS